MNPDKKRRKKKSAKKIVDQILHAVVGKEWC